MEGFSYNLENVGELSGVIWKYLDEFGISSTFQLKIALGVNNAMLYLALGWLLRENKINMESLDKGYKIIKK
jgi:hypothetical protein